MKKLGAVVGGLAAGAINPAFLAVTALGVGLDLLGQSQQKAAEKAAAHKQNVESLTAALREDQGVLGEHVNKVNAKALADKNAASNLATFGQTVGTATAAIQGSNQAYDMLKFSAGAALATIADQAGVTGASRDAFIDLATVSLDTGQNYGDLKDKVKLYGTALDGTNGQVQRFSAQQMSAAEAVLNANGAVGEQMRSTLESRQNYMAMEHALTGLSDAQIRARDATTQHTAAIYEQMNASLGHRGAVLNTKTAIDELAKVNQNAKSTEDQKAAAMLGAENAMARQIAAAGQLAASNAGAVSDSQRLEIQTRAQNQETINLANSWAGPLPASLQTAISKMSVTEAKAAGLKVGVDNLGRAVVTLPDGKQIVLTSTAAAAEAKVHQLQQAINELHGKDIKIAVSYYGTGPRPSSLRGPNIAFGEGGLISKGPAQKRSVVANDSGNMLRPMSGSLAKVVPSNTWRIVGDNMTHPELFAPLDGSTRSRKLIVQAAKHEGILPLAEGGLIGAAKEALAHVKGGGQFFEDFTFYGNSDNVGRYNDQLAGLFYASQKPGWDFDATERTRADIVGWLQGYVAQHAAASAVKQAVTSGAAVKQAPTFQGSPPAAAQRADGGAFTGKLFLDNGTFLGVVRGEIRKDKRATRRDVAMGSGAAR